MAGKAKKAGKVARRIGAGLLGRAKPRAMSAGIGGAIRLVEKLAQGNVEFVRDNWYGGPLLMFGASMAVKNERLSTALATVAGYKGAFNYEVKEFSNGRMKENPMPSGFLDKPAAGSQAQALPQAAPAAGAGLMEDAEADAGLLFN